MPDCNKIGLEIEEDQMWWYKYIRSSKGGIERKLLLEAESREEVLRTMNAIEKGFDVGCTLTKYLHGPYKTKKEARKRHSFKI